MSANKLLLLFPSTNRHIGLWKDLENDERCILRCTEKKSIRNKFVKGLRYLYFQIYKRFKWIAFHSFWYEYHDIYKIVKHVAHLVIIDGALNTVDLSELRKCKKINPSLKISLYLINSMDAHSPIMRKVRPKINAFKWDKIYTFDPIDAQKYDFDYLGFNYFSSQEVNPSNLPNSDIFFVGGLKGGRTELIYNLYTRLRSQGFKCDFILYPIDDMNIKHLPDAKYCTKWFPYKDILQHVQHTDCIVEIVQDGQSGATLRYFEAVSMNKKLLTNNPHIVNFPYYNSQWMKVFKSVDDIDFDWLNIKENVDFKYNGDFSPINFVNFLFIYNK